MNKFTAPDGQRLFETRAGGMYGADAAGVFDIADEDAAEAVGRGMLPVSTIPPKPRAAPEATIPLVSDAKPR